jgi:hypothetical protein
LLTELKSRLSGIETNVVSISERLGALHDKALHKNLFQNDPTFYQELGRTLDGMLEIARLVNFEKQNDPTQGQTDDNESWEGGRSGQIDTFDSYRSFEAMELPLQLQPLPGLATFPEWESIEPFSDWRQEIPSYAEQYQSIKMTSLHSESDDYKQSMTDICSMPSNSLAASWFEQTFPEQPNALQLTTTSFPGSNNYTFAEYLHHTSMAIAFRYLHQQNRFPTICATLFAYCTWFGSKNELMVRSRFMLQRANVQLLENWIEDGDFKRVRERREVTGPLWMNAKDVERYLRRERGVVFEDSGLAVVKVTRNSHKRSTKFPNSSISSEDASGTSQKLAVTLSVDEIVQGELNQFSSRNTSLKLLGLAQCGRCLDTAPGYDIADVDRIILSIVKSKQACL